MYNTYGIGADCRWPDVLSNLLAAADWGSPFAPQFKLRALRSLKHIFKGLMTKRFVAEPLPQQPGSSAALGKLVVFPFPARNSGTFLLLFGFPPCFLVMFCMIAPVQAAGAALSEAHLQGADDKAVCRGIAAAAARLLSSTR
jgi:hypothetical protein